MVPLIASAAVAAALLSAPAAEGEFRVVRLGENAAIFQTGREDTTNVLVLESRRGLAVVDTGVLPSRGAALRAAIEREFHRKDFAYIVNTHPHFDHIDGNQAFADVPIVAHQNAVREMTRWYGSPAAIEAFLRIRDRWQAQLEEELRSAAAGSREEAQAREQIAENAALAEEFRSGRFEMTPPTVTFSDRLTLDLGDLTLNLVHFGRAHTESDILVHVPQLRMLLVGDLFAGSWLPSFLGDSSDVPRWFQVLDGLPAGPQAVERVISGHGDPMTGDDLRAQVAYLRDLWDGVEAARDEGATLAATRERFPFVERYPALSGLSRVWDGRDQHLANIDQAWRLQSEPAARVLESLITARGLQEAAAEYRKTIAGNERYKVIENEMIALGYRYLQSGRTPEAIAVFEIDAEAFPRSWNAWDSLAEAHNAAGDREKAETFYAKSVEINPDNQNGRDYLSQLRGYKLDAQGETKEPLRFQPGSKTGLRRPYLGQRPPGSAPRLFAPGIVSSAGSLEFAITFTPDGKEIYFTRHNVLMVSRLGEDNWTAPEEAAFSRGFPSNEPHITQDGRKLFFGSRRPRPGVEGEEYGIWVVERTADGGWSEPRYHGPGMYVSAARNGYLYMTDVTNVAGTGRAAIVYPWADGRYGPPQRLGGGVNAPRVADHVFVAPDETYILLDSPNRPGGQGGDGDLYVCFREPDGSWGEAVNLGDAINTPGTNFCPTVSPDGKYIFYTTNRDIYWVSAKILDRLKASLRR